MRDPALIPLSRLLALRQFPFLAHAELDELVMFAENASEVTFERGAAVALPADEVPALHLVLEGAIAQAPDATPRGAHEVFGLLEVLAGRPVAAPAHAVAWTRTLRLAARDCTELLEDNFGVLRGLLRGLAVNALTRGVPFGPRTLAPAVPATPLTLVERLIVLRRQLALPGARLQPLAALAHASEERHWAASTTVVRAGERAAGALVILDGTLRASCCEDVPALVTGDAIGGLETLAATHHAHTFVAATAVRALHASDAALHDVLEDHTDLALALVARLAGAMLDAGAAYVEVPPSASATWAVAHEPMVS